MKADVGLDLKPFIVPQCVNVAGLENEREVSFPISVISATDLERMCDEFRDAVFKKAGKPRPGRRGRKPAPDNGN